MFTRTRALLVLAVVGAAMVVPATAQAATKWAVVNSSGTIVRSVGTTSAAKLGTGQYEVIFNSNMTHCAYIATAGDPGAGAVAGPIGVTVASRATNANGVYLETWNLSTNTRVDEPFHLATYCGTTVLDAVVGNNGVKARGAHVASTKRISTGLYEVVFNQNVKLCAYTASIGTTSAGAATPGTITVASRANKANGVLIRTEDTTGALSDRGFHLGVICGDRNYAVVKADGTKVRGPHVVSTAKLAGPGTGTYEVIFDRTVSGCMYTASPGVPGTGQVMMPAVVTTATRAGNPNGVFIFMHLSNGTTFDSPFHLILYC
jgi:hypothetical protein